MVSSLLKLGRSLGRAIAVIVTKCFSAQLGREQEELELLTLQVIWMLLWLAPYPSFLWNKHYFFFFSFCRWCFPDLLISVALLKACSWFIFFLKSTVTNVQKTWNREEQTTGLAVLTLHTSTVMSAFAMVAWDCRWASSLWLTLPSGLSLQSSPIYLPLCPNSCPLHFNKHTFLLHHPGW